MLLKVQIKKKKRAFSLAARFWCGREIYLYTHREHKQLPPTAMGIAGEESYMWERKVAEWAVPPNLGDSVLECLSIKKNHH